MLKNIIKLLIATFVLMIVVLTQAPDLQASAATEGKTGLITVNANVYKGPGKSFGTASKVGKEQLVTFYETKNGWTYVVSETAQGWVWRDYVQSSQGVGLLNNSWANLYPKVDVPAEDSKITQGTPFIIFGEKNGWRNIYVNGRYAQVWGEFVTKSSGIGTISPSYVNLYKGAGKATGGKGTIQKGATVKLAESKNGWRHIYLDGQEGWVWDEFISKAAYNNAYEGIITASDYANVYNTNGKSGGIKGKVHSNSAQVIKVSVFQQKNGWSYMRGKQLGSNSYIEGWVWGTYITPSHHTGVIRSNPDAAIYNEPNESSGIKGKVKNGALVAAYESKNGWKKIKSGDTTGWVPDGKVEKKRSAPTNSIGVGAASANVNVYAGPAKSYSAMGTIPKGAAVSIYQFQNGWRYVHAGYIEGWVWGEYVDPLAGVTVFLDPGHGQNDPGAIGFGLKEKDVVLDIGLKARALFISKSPLNIMMTRSADSSEVTADGKDITTAVSLKLRTDFAKKHQKSDNDIFISLHANAFNGSAEGGESYYYAARAGNPHTEESKLLAASIQERLVENMTLKDRGIKPGNLAVLRENVMPATLIEMGFIDNKNDNDKLKDEYWRDQAAKAIYQGTLDYYKEKGFNVDAYGL